MQCKKILRRNYHLRDCVIIQKAEYFIIYFIFTTYNSVFQYNPISLGTFNFCAWLYNHNNYMNK